MEHKDWKAALESLDASLDELSAKAAEAAESARAARQAKKEELEEKLRDARGDLTALQEQARQTGERGRSKLFSELLKARMTVEAKAQDAKDARDRKRLARYVEDQVKYAAECHDAALFLIAEAELAALEAVLAAAEYDERFGGETT